MFRGDLPAECCVGLPVYRDVSLKDFPEVFPAGGAPNAAIRITPTRLADLTRAEWVDVTKLG